MTYWIISSRLSFFHLDDYFMDNDVVDWKQNFHFLAGDIVFIYVAAPLMTVGYMTVVEKTDMTKEETIDDTAYWGEEHDDIVWEKYVRLRLISSFDKSSSQLHYDQLLKYGLKGPIQGGQKLKGELLDYILGCTHVEEVPTDNGHIEYVEGDVKAVSLNRYERNSEARARCIAHYGYKCQICGMDFEKVYGEVGKGFIHVHHVVPISEIGTEYKVDPIKDLIPVCPNCHAMLHRKVDGELLDWKELKQNLLNG